MPSLKSLAGRVLPRELHGRLFGKRLSKERFILIIQAVIARIIGRWVHCHVCGGRVAKVIVFSYRSGVAVWGIHLAVARVDFADRLHIRFAHALAQDCHPPSKL